MNIVWRHTSGRIAVTHLVEGHHETPEQHAQTLLQRKDIPPGYQAVGYAVEDLPHHLPLEVWDWQGGKAVMHVAKAREWHKARLRRERVAALQALDIQSLRNSESGTNNASVLERKQALRDITKLVDNLTDWNSMSAVTIPQEIKT